MNLSSSEYFLRQTTIPEIGTAGLEKLQRTSVTVVGVGGVGATVAHFLAGSGIGNLRLIDQDIVEPSNLPRLIGVGKESLYRPKAEVIADNISKTSVWTKVEPRVETLRPSNLTELLAQSNLIVDGLDNFRTRYHVNRYALEKRVPYIFTSAIAMQGHIGIFAPPETPCLTCMSPNVGDRIEESCEALGVIPAVVGLVGAIAANEAVKTLLGLSTVLRGGLLTVDMGGTDFIVSKILRRDDCEICGRPGATSGTPQATLTVLCGENTFNVIPARPVEFDLRRVSDLLHPDEVLAETGSVVVFRTNGLSVSFFRSGRLMIRGAAGEEDVLRIANELWSKVSEENSLVQVL